MTKRGLRLGFVLGTATFAGLAACTLVYPLGGYSDGTPSEDASESSVAVEAAADGEAPNDARVDAPDGDASAASRYATAVLLDGPLLYYRFGDVGGTVARDEVSGTSIAYPTTGIRRGDPGALGGDPDTSITFDGSGRMVVPDIAEFPELAAFSVEMWIKPSMGAGSTGISFIVDHERWDMARRGWTVRAGKVDFAMERWNPDASTAIGIDPPALETWHHYVTTFDGAKMRMFVDGVRVSEGGTALPVPARGGGFTIAGQNCSSCTGNGYAGGLDELAIYAKPLTDTQVAAHYAAGK